MSITFIEFIGFILGYVIGVVLGCTVFFGIEMMIKKFFYKKIGREWSQKNDT